MTEETETLMIAILRNIQSDLAQVKERLDRVETRLDDLAETNARFLGHMTQQGTTQARYEREMIGLSNRVAALEAQLNELRPT